MTIHQCPKCELRFEWKAELDDHCWHDHPEFRHDYPASPAPHPAADPPPRAHVASRGPAPRHVADGFVRWLAPRQREAPPHPHHPPSEAQTEHSDG